ncbi:MAG: proteasome subunit beta [Actinomycetota bacterium]
MTLPYFDPTEDPGPSFAGLLQHLGATPDYTIGSAGHAAADALEITHGTTVVASTFADGVVIAGDRRATSGNLISYRNMNKVFPADRWSGVAIAGAAGPALEMVKMFQLQLEHYEKVEGRPLSLEGKANQLSQMLRQHLPAAMQGMVVVPVFAGYDRRREFGRLFAYDVTGGRYEEDNFVASGSGSLFARTVIKLGHRDDNSRDDAVNLMIRALFNAADDDSATGGPDSMRGIYPIVSVITADGYQELEEGDIAERFETVLADFAGRDSEV